MLWAMTVVSGFRSDDHPRDTNGRFTRRTRPQGPDEAVLDSECRQRIEEWVAEASTHTIVERIDSRPGFLADCVVAPGAITVGHDEQEARDEMRSALTDWANLRVSRGYDLPKLPSDAVAH